MLRHDMRWQPWFILLVICTECSATESPSRSTRFTPLSTASERRTIIPNVCFLLFSAKCNSKTAVASWKSPGFVGMHACTWSQRLQLSRASWPNHPDRTTARGVRDSKEWFSLTSQNSLSSWATGPGASWHRRCTRHPDVPLQALSQDQSTTPSAKRIWKVSGAAAVQVQKLVGLHPWMPHKHEISMEYKLSPISSIFNLWSVEWGPQNGAHGISKIQQGRFENMCKLLQEVKIWEAPKLSKAVMGLDIQRSNKSVFRTAQRPREGWDNRITDMATKCQRCIRNKPPRSESRLESMESSPWSFSVHLDNLLICLQELAYQSQLNMSAAA